MGNPIKKMQNAKRAQSSIDSIFLKKSDPLELQVRKAEVKMTGFIAEHNIPLAVADHLGPFLDSKKAKNYACGKAKSTCILNRAIKPDLQSSLLEHIKNNYFSISTDGSNDQGLSKMNPVTVRLFDINQHKVVTQFLAGMCLSTSSTADGIFTSIDNVFVQNELSWNNCISLGVDNTSVNIGKHHSLVTKAREKNSDIILMGCPVTWPTTLNSMQFKCLKVA